MTAKGENMWITPTEFDCKKIKSELGEEIILYKFYNVNYSVPNEGWYFINGEKVFLKPGDIINF